MPSRHSIKVAFTLAILPCFAASIAHAEAPVPPPVPPSVSAPAPTPIVTTSTTTTGAPIDTATTSGRALTEWGDIAVLATERVGKLYATSAAKGNGGTMVGAGLEVRSFNPVGWGGYYRWTTFTQSDSTVDNYEIRELGIGVLRRLHASGDSGSLIRTFSVVGFGATWSWVDTNLNCSSSYVPFTARCSTIGYGTTAFVSGDSLGLEARAQLGIAISWITISAEVGISGWYNLTTSDNELTPPQWAWTPTAAIMVGIGLPYSDKQPAK